MRFVVCVVVLALSACQAERKSADKGASAEPARARGSEASSAAASGKGAAAATDPAPTESDEPGGAEASGYAGDIQRICSAEQLSGASELDEGARPMHVAQWLGANIETEDGRQFLASLARAKPHEKVELLSAESAKLGLEGCELASAWSGGGRSTN